MLNRTINQVGLTFSLTLNLNPARPNVESYSG